MEKPFEGRCNRINGSTDDVLVSLQPRICLQTRSAVLLDGDQDGAQVGLQLCGGMQQGVGILSDGVQDAPCTLLAVSI